MGRKLAMEERQRSWRNYCELNAHSQFHREALCYIQVVLSLNKGAGVPQEVCGSPSRDQVTTGPRVGDVLGTATTPS